MAMTIPEAFDAFHTRLTPTITETQNAKSHRASIEACIKSNFGLNRFFRTGSFGNGTSISGYSDVDYFASIPRENLKKDSGITLHQAEKILDTRFPQTGVKIDAPAVVIPFGTDPAETTEVVFADYIGTDTKYGKSMYEIPNGIGGWMRSSPDAHNYYVDYFNDKLGKKVKPLVRFIKAWKYYRMVPISSFYLEIFVTRYAAAEESILFSIDVKRIFEQLAVGQLPDIDDPMGVSGKISACKAADRADVLEKLGRAVIRAKNARSSEEAGKISDAFDWWNKVYNDGFPKYH